MNSGDDATTSFPPAASNVEARRALLTVLMSTVMLACEDAWLSGTGQEFIGAEAWTRPVCYYVDSGDKNRYRRTCNPVEIYSF